MTVAILLRRALARPGQSDEHEVLGPCERGALVVGLRIGAALGEDVVAISAGPARREDRVLAMALRAGASRAVRLGADGIDELDYLGLAEVLAATVRTVGAKVIACGDRSIDERTGAVGPALAELLGYSHVTGIASVAVDGPHVPAGSGSAPAANAAGRWDPRILCERYGDGQRDRLALRPPVVLCVRPPRAAEPEPEPEPDALARPERARTSPQAIDAVDAAEIDIDMRRLAPRRHTGGRLRAVRGGDQAMILPTAAALVDRLEAEALVRRGPR